MGTPADRAAVDCDVKSVLSEEDSMYDCLGMRFQPCSIRTAKVKASEVTQKEGNSPHVRVVDFESLFTSFCCFVVLVYKSLPDWSDASTPRGVGPSLVPGHWFLSPFCAWLLQALWLSRCLSCVTVTNCPPQTALPTTRGEHTLSFSETPLINVPTL